MSVKVDKLVYAGLEAARLGGVVRMDDRAEVALWCSEMGFYVAQLWLDANSESYARGLESGFESHPAWSQADHDHIVIHTAQSLAERSLPVTQATDPQVAAVLHTLSAAPQKEQLSA